MKFHIKACMDETVALMTEKGQVLGHFASVYDALQTCEDLLPANAGHEIRSFSRDVIEFAQKYDIAV